mgnify:CR=1 FL=1
MVNFVKEMVHFGEEWRYCSVSLTTAIAWKMELGAAVFGVRDGRMKLSAFSRLRSTFLCFSNTIVVFTNESSGTETCSNRAKL